MAIPLIYNPYYSFPFPNSHRFPMKKFEYLFAYLQETGIAQRNNVFRPGRALDGVLELAHCSRYIDRFINNQQSAAELRRMGLPWSEPLVRRSLISPNGTLLAASIALEHGIACHLAGGTHHAHYDFASGYCILNDLAVASRSLIQRNKARRILIFDCDVHQGDGTATILADDDRIYTCSIHCEKNFPARKANSNLDVGLPPGIRDEEYLQIIEQTLQQAIHASQPDLILYDAGVDVYANDGLGLINISETGIAERETLVLKTALESGIPIATVLGGGYDRDEKALAKRHALAIAAASDLFN